jgi:hypothetical protein
LFDELGLTRKSGPVCPKCGASIQPHAALCTGCGFNFQTGEQLSAFNVRTEAPEFDNPFLQEAVNNMRREDVSEERMAKAGMPWWMLVAFIFGVITIGAAGLILVEANTNPSPPDTPIGRIQQQDFRVIIGFTLIAVGVMISNFAHLSILVFAFRTSAKEGALVMFAPFYNLYFAIKYWADNKSAVFAMLWSGLLAGVGIGLVIAGGGPI